MFSGFFRGAVDPPAPVARISKMIENNVQEVRVYDESRTPRNWNELLGATQCAAFLRRVDSEVPLSVNGSPLGYRDATFIIFDRLDEARRFCEELVQRHPKMCCEIFDSDGKARPPLLTIMHPGAKHELSAASVRKRRLAAIALLIFAGPLIWWDWYKGSGLIYPTVIGVNMIVAGMRLLLWNAAKGQRSTEEAERVQEHLARENGANPGS